MISPFVPIPIDTLFADDYRAADAALCQLAAKLGREPDDTVVPPTGPAGEPLHTRHLWLGNSDASKVLVLISGTHGVEGLAGSAIQQDLLAQMHVSAWQPPVDTAILLVHLLNPFGCAWARRCDQDGIDLNRNFVDFTQPLPANAGYLELRAALLSGNDAIRQTAQADYARQHGQTALEVAVSGGQFSDPAGPWFGGNQPAFARRYIEQLMTQYRLAERQLAVIDLHTGLGPYAHGEIICDHPAASAGTQVARRWYGEAVTLPELGTSFSAPKQGLMDYGWHAIMNDASCFVTLEFGSGCTAQLFRVLLDDHALHAQGRVDWLAPATRRVKDAMLAHFYPLDRHWRESVILKARGVITLALTGLAHGR